MIPMLDAVWQMWNSRWSPLDSFFSWSVAWRWRHPASAVQRSLERVNLGGRTREVGKAPLAFTALSLSRSSSLVE
jgi:hypothetical protein